MRTKKKKKASALILTPEQFADEIKEIIKEYPRDREAGGVQLDGAMCHMLIQLGYLKGVKLYNTYERW